MEVQYFNKFKLSNKFTTLPWTDKTKSDGSNLSHSRLMFNTIGNKIIPANRWKLCHATDLWNISQWYHKDSELLTTYFGFLFHRIISTDSAGWKNSGSLEPQSLSDVTEAECQDSGKVGALYLTQLPGIHVLINKCRVFSKVSPLKAMLFLQPLQRPYTQPVICGSYVVSLLTIIRKYL